MVRLRARVVRRGDALEALVWCSKDDQIHVAGGKPGVRRPPMATGTGKLKAAGGVSGKIKESINRAFGFLQTHKSELGLGGQFSAMDYHVEVIDLLNNHAEGDMGMGFLIALVSALRKSPVTAATLILGDVSIQGNVKPLTSLVEPLQIAKDNGARRALIPIGNKRHLDKSICPCVNTSFTWEFF